MKKLLLAALLATSGISASSQVYNNEWINYSKTYYKFSVGSTGLYRISQPVLSSAGLASTPAQNFQLWHNGKEVPMYTSIASGTLTASDYLEFYGEMNDGTADKVLYKYDTLQMSDKWSILTDTAAYFLTVNTGTNKRYTNTPNNVAGNALPAETYFTHKLGSYFKNMQNPGFGIDFGELVSSSAFDVGEGWTSPSIYVAPYGPGYLYENNPNLYVYTSGPAASIKATAAGNYSDSRNISLSINGSTLATNYVNNFNATKFNVTNIPLSTFNGDAATVTFTQDGQGFDHVVVSYYELSYPRQYNFGGLNKFYFELPSGASKYLNISNFNFGSTAPILYDIANNVRLTGDINGGFVRFVLPTATLARKLVLLSADPTALKSVTGLTQRTFVNYGLAANQGNYMIISHPLLFNNGSGVDNVENYRLYRASAAGGSFNAKVVDINQLIDQFAFGIKHHPSSIRNFAAYALANFTTPPAYFFLIGKGLDYTSFNAYEGVSNTSSLALVPTFGWPASDNLLTASRLGNTPLIPIGRLSAISGTEVGDYLDKVKQYEQAQTGSPQTIAGQSWMKNIAQITGAIDDPSLYALITGYMQGYEQVLKDTAFGGKVYNFSKNSGQYTALGSTKTIDNLFVDGMSLITYFGHSSPNTLEFNLDNPQNYSNTGKYPLIVVNGCNTGNLFTFDTLRPISKGTLSEKYVFSPQKGSIGFIADTHFGLPQQLNYFNYAFAGNISNAMYGQTIGNIMKTTMESLNANYPSDFLARCHSEEITYHGDPAIRLNPHTLPDFTTQDSLITFNPSAISVADETVTITTKILNIGKAINDSVTIRFQHQLPDNSVVTLATRRIKATLYEDTLQLTYKVNPIKDKGLNKIIVTIDPAGLIPELSESNNTVTKDFTIAEDEIRPVYPFNYAIVNNAASLALYGSTANPTATSKQYVMEMDTSKLFNSSSKITRTVTNTGGVIKFLPGISLVDSTVYYWRVTVGPVNASSNWRTSSFVYINNSYEGFNQSHYYQFKDDNYDGINLDTVTRKFNFSDKTRKLLIRTGLYPYYGWDQINVNVDNDQLNGYGCWYGALQFVVYDPLTLKPWVNYNVTGTTARFGSRTICDGATRNIFEFTYTDTGFRRNAMNFFDSIPTGYYVSVSNLSWIGFQVFIDSWKSDTTYFGSGKSLWHKFHSMGLHKIDSFTRNIPFLFVFKKGDTLSYSPRQHMGTVDNEHIVDTFNILGKNIEGTVETPYVGPAKAWKNFKWNTKVDSAQSSNYDLVGKDAAGNEVTLASVVHLKDTAVNYINATTYPYLKMRMYTTDPSQAKATQLKYWMLTADEYPEGAIAPNSVFQFQDTVNATDTLKLRVAFKNISKIAFDSIKVKLTITDNAGVLHVYNNQANNARLKPLVTNDSVIITYNIPAAGYTGANQVYLDVNPDNDQPEQFHFNNILFRSWYVNNPACPGGNITFASGSSGAGITYQWQVNTGSGYTNVVNGGVYSGATSASLVLTTPPTSMYGYKYRCTITNNGQNTYSGEYILKFSLTWTGSVSTAWETVGNWSCAVLPDANTDVVVPAGVTNFPRVNTIAPCRSVTAKPGCTITVITGSNLKIMGPSQ